jgi:ribosome-associated protein
MELTNEQKEKLIGELIFTSSRSSGPGGQHVNKVNTKIELRFRIVDSVVLSIEQKSLLFKKLSKKLTLEGELLVTAQNDRSQLKNKELSIAKFFEIIDKALKPRKRRVPTKPTLTSIKNRMEEKKRIATRKVLRKPPKDEL